MCKKFISLMLTIIFMMSLSNIVFAADNEISVNVNGAVVEFDQPPVVEDGRTLIPFRAVLEKMGIDVQWDLENKMVICMNEEITVSLTVGETEMSVFYADENIEDEVITLDVPAKIENGRTLVPIRAIAESFDADVIWDEDTRTISIITELDIQKLNDAAEEFKRVSAAISDKFTELDDAAMEEFEEIVLEMSNFLQEVLANPYEIEESQENVDELTEKLEEYTAQIKEFAEKNDISLE